MFPPVVRDSKIAALQCKVDIREAVVSEHATIA